MSKENRKAMVMQAMQEKITPGIFRIICEVSERSYIGASMNMEKAFNRHAGELKFKSHPCKTLQEDWDKFGVTAFKTEFVAEVPADRVPDFSLLNKMLIEYYEVFIQEGIKVEKLLQ